MMLMFTTLIAGATFAAIFSGFIVQKIRFTVLSVAVYVYLFTTVPDSLSLELGFVSDHPVLTGGVVLSSAVLLVLVGRYFWHRLADSETDEDAGVRARVRWRPASRRRQRSRAVALPARGRTGYRRLAMTAVAITSESATRLPSAASQLKPMVLR